jgi:hypothetical protein
VQVDVGQERRYHRSCPVPLSLWRERGTQNQIARRPDDEDQWR